MAKPYYIAIFLKGEDDCGNGAEDFSYHFDRTDPECRSYYRCNNVGDIITTDECPEGEMINALTQLCVLNNQFECYVG